MRTDLSASLGGAEAAKQSSVMTAAPDRFAAPAMPCFPLRSSHKENIMQFHMIAGGPQPVAPFSHAVESDGFVFVTGQMPDSPGAPGVLPEGIIAQTQAVMQNLAYILQGLNVGFEHILMARIYLTRFKEDYAAMNETWRAFFPADRLPARTCVGVTALAYDALIEIDLVCRRP